MDTYLANKDDPVMSTFSDIVVHKFKGPHDYSQRVKYTRLCLRTPEICPSEVKTVILEDMNLKQPHWKGLCRDYAAPG